MSATTLYLTGDRHVRLESESVPEPAPDEVLVETQVTAVSAGTELLLYRGEAPERIDAEGEIETLTGDISYPTESGYAAVGDVVDVGRSVAESWMGRTVFAFSPHRSHFTAPPDRLYPVPSDIRPETAALLPIAETATNLAMDGRPMVGERVTVFGAGMVGLVTTQVLSTMPLTTLTVAEPVLKRRELANRIGADETIHPERSSELGTRGDPPGQDLVYELSGHPGTLNRAIDAVGYDGRVIVGSWYGEKTADVDFGGFFHRNNVSIDASQVSRIAPAFRGRWTKSRRISVAWDRLRDIDASRLITHRLPFTDAAEAFRILDDGPDDVLQVLLTFE